MSEIRRRFLIAASCLGGAALAVNVAATQFVAWRLGYHPALGRPVAGAVYPPWSWIGWRKAAWAANAARTFALLDMGLYGGGALATLGLLAAANRGRRYKPTRHEDVHGTARFGGEADLRDAGLLPPAPGMEWAGVYVGAWEARDGTLHYLRHNGPEHVLGIGPIRSGKLVGLVIPTLTTWPDSAVIYDEKGEIWESTSGWREREAGNRVLRWEPGSPARAIGFNFLSEVRLGTGYEFRDIANIMEMVADPEGAGMEGHWEPSAAEVLNGVALHVCHERRAAGGQASLADVLRALSDPHRGRDALYEAMRRSGHAQVAAIGQDMLNKDVRERSGIHSTATRMLRLFRDPIVAANTARSDFTIGDLMNGDLPVSLYIVTRGEDKLRLRPLVRLFLTLMFARLLGADMRIERGRPASPHRRRLLVLIDEFASLRKMEAVQEALSKCAGYGIKAYLLVQDREQIINEYGPNESITSHCHIKAAFAPTNYRTAEWLSDMAGTATVVREDVTESGARGGTMRNVSRAYHTVSRPLITPDEVMRLKAPRKDAGGRITEAGHVLVFAAGRAPVLATQSLYFRDPEFLRRVAMPAPEAGP